MPVDEIGDWRLQCAVTSPLHALLLLLQLAAAVPRCSCADCRLHFGSLRRTGTTSQHGTYAMPSWRRTPFVFEVDGRLAEAADVIIVVLGLQLPFAAE